MAIAAAIEQTPAIVTDTESVDASAVAARYVQIGKALKGGSDELWARYRLIRINDALKSEVSRRDTLLALRAIERAIAR